MRFITVRIRLIFANLRPIEPGVHGGISHAYQLFCALVGQRRF